MADGAGGVVVEVAAGPVFAGEAEVLGDDDEIGEADALPSRLASPARV